MNIYYLKKFRKEAYQRLKLIKIKTNLYYVAMVFGGWGCSDNIFRRSDDLSYKDALKKLKEVRRNYILDKVYESRLTKSKIVKHI